MAKGLPLQSAPLLLYYAFMNAAKALLAAKGIAFSPMHGVSEWKPPTGTKLKGVTVAVRIKPHGVLPSLARYYGESETRTHHTLKDILYNLPYIHRTYCLTYTSQPEMFVPLRMPSFVVEEGTSHVFFTALLSQHYATSQYMQNASYTHAHPFLLARYRHLS